MWMGIIKILAPSAITAIVLGYIFNRRLEKYKMLLKVNETYIASLIDGLNEFMGDFKAVVEKSIELETQVKANDTNKKTLEEFLELSEKYKVTLKGHRVYLAPLIPFGYSGSDVGIQAVVAMNLFIESIVRKDIQFSESNKKALFASINELNRAYRITSSNANKVLNKVQVGKPFNLLLK